MIFFNWTLKFPSIRFLIDWHCTVSQPFFKIFLGMASLCLQIFWEINSTFSFLCFLHVGINCWIFQDRQCLPDNISRLRKAAHRTCTRLIYKVTNLLWFMYYWSFSNPNPSMLILLWLTFVFEGAMRPFNNG